MYTHDAVSMFYLRRRLPELCCIFRQAIPLFKLLIHYYTTRSGSYTVVPSMLRLWRSEMHLRPIRKEHCNQQVATGQAKLLVL